MGIASMIFHSKKISFTNLSKRKRCQLSTKDSDTFTRRKIYSSWWDLSMDSGTIHRYRWSSIEMFETPPGQLKRWATKTQKPCYFPDFNPGSLIPGCLVHEIIPTKNNWVGCHSLGPGLHPKAAWQQRLLRHWVPQRGSTWQPGCQKIRNDLEKTIGKYHLFKATGLFFHFFRQLDCCFRDKVDGNEQQRLICRDKRMTHPKN